MDIFSIFFIDITVYCVFSLESPHRGYSNKYAGPRSAIGRAPAS